MKSMKRDLVKVTGFLWSRILVFIYQIMVCIRCFFARSFCCGVSTFPRLASTIFEDTNFSDINIVSVWKNSLLLSQVLSCIIASCIGNWFTKKKWISRISLLVGLSLSIHATNLLAKIEDFVITFIGCPKKLTISYVFAFRTLALNSILMLSSLGP